MALGRKGLTSGVIKGCACFTVCVLSTVSTVLCYTEPYKVVCRS
ncbi:unnamed protein product [Staurois parvus]|uniref:Uncharacterized protein n=1 Tax=Staurois parvus TaxID=386267 RepID=A0ABN9EXK4_9NEOB|nr:unnamed protein product [Staurois parvus]